MKINKETGEKINPKKYKGDRRKRNELYWHTEGRKTIRKTQTKKPTICRHCKTDKNKKLAIDGSSRCIDCSKKKEI